MKIQQKQVTSQTAGQVFKELNAAIKSGDFLLDFSGVSTIDSSAVALVLHGLRSAKRKKAAFKVANAPESFGRLVAAYSLESLFEEVFV